MDCLVDTSVWIDFFNGTKNAGVERLKSLLNHGEVATSPVILMEVFQGIRSDQTCKRVQQQLACLSCYPIADGRYIEAAHLYRQLRKQGVTVRKSIDCLIASVALYFKLPVLHRDRYLTHIARHSDLICFSPDQH